MNDIPMRPQQKKRWLSTELNAWLVLSAFFVASVVVAAYLGRLAWANYTAAVRTVDGAQLRSHVATGVLYQEPRSMNSRTLERLPAAVDPCRGEVDICMPLKPGYRIKTLPAAGYGPVASLVLPDASHIQLWAQDSGADVIYHTYQVSRWTQAKQIVNLVQNSGYARYDVADFQPYDIVEYSVTLPDGYKVWMTPGGSYSVRVLTENKPDRVDTPTRIEVAVRSGSATVSNGQQNVSVAQQEMVIITTSPSISVPVAATWQLVHDPEWAEIKTPNAAAESVNSWVIYTREGSPDMSPAEKNGKVSVMLGCSPERQDNCKDDKQLQILRLQRSGLQVHDFAVGVEQYLDADVSEFTSLRLTAWVRLLAQQSATGTAASASCPIKFQLIYKFISPADPQQERTICLYAAKTSTGDIEKPEDQQETGETLYRALPLYRWFKLDLDLREDEFLKLARYIQVLRIEADGVNYLAEVTDLSLTGRQ